MPMDIQHTAASAARTTRLRAPRDIASDVAAAHGLGGGSADTFRLMQLAIEADRADRDRLAHVRAIDIVHENYGADSDPEVHARATELADAFSGNVDAKYLLAVALDLQHLNSDGILAMLAEAARG